MSSRRPVSPRASKGRRHGTEHAAGSPSRTPSTGRPAGGGTRQAGPGRTPGGGGSRTRHGASRPGAAPPATGRTAGDNSPRPEGRRRHVLRWGAGRGTEAPRPAISLRALGLLLVVLVAFVVLAPTLRYAVTQREDLRALNAEVVAAEERTAQLEDELERWQDPAYVQAQARDRLGYVVPGETPYVVIDPETVVGQEAEQAREAAQNAQPDVVTPWYLDVWESIGIAGQAAAGAEGTSDPAGQQGASAPAGQQGSSAPAGQQGTSAPADTHGAP